MAIGMDSSLRGNSRQQVHAPMQATASRPQASPAPQISEAAVQGAVNNQLASGYGTRESALRGQDRAGISRGKGQQYYANAAQESADTTAAANATKTMMDVAAANNATQFDYDKTMWNESLSRQNILEGLRNSQAMAGLGVAAAQMQAALAAKRGKFSLDSMQLDYTPLLQGLFN